VGKEVSPSTRQRKARWLGNRGTVAVMMAVCAPLILITVGLGIEASGWVGNQQGWMQRTADMAAIAGGLAYSTGVGAQTSVTEAAYVAEVNTNGTARTGGTRSWNGTTQTLSDTVVANNVITTSIVSGVRATGDVAISAQIQYTLPLFFSALAMHRYNASITLSATATAENIPGQIGKYCILALDGSTSTGASTSGIEFENGAAVDLSACGIQVNALGADALYLTGGADLIANSVAVAGNYSISNGATMSVSGATVTGAAAGVNPYANVPIPTPGTCATNNSFNTGQNIPAGTYCNGLTINYGTVTMGPGIIIVDGGNFHPTGGSTVNAANGTTIVLTGSSGSNVGTSQIDNGVTINLVAPTTGPTAGIAIIQDSRAGATTSNMAGGASVNVTGALVFPSSVVDFSNGSSNNSTCTQLIAFQVVFTGGARFGNSCAGTGTSGIGATTTTTLVQ
jgi:hypothetical protein